VTGGGTGSVMTHVAPAGAVSESAPRRPPPPTPREIASRVVVSLLVAVVAPAAFFGASLVLFDIRVAVIVALAWMAVAMGWRRVSGRAVSPLLMLTLVVMALRTAFTLLTGNTFVYFIQPVFADAAVAAIFLGSLCTTRPLVARLAPDFYPMDDALAARPGMRRLFRRLTLLWGVVIMAKGSATLVLLVSLSVIDFVLVKSVTIIALTLTGVAVTLALSIIVGRREGII
jgi:intracellular septation protein A